MVLDYFENRYLAIEKAICFVWVITFQSFILFGTADGTPLDNVQI